MRPKIYVAGPMTKGNRYDNIHNGMMIGRQLIRAGFAPMIPHLTHFVDPDDSLGWEAWLQVDEAWLLHADGLYRMPGESAGADREVAFALEHDIPVFYRYELLRPYFQGALRGV
jgi:hypothetical protein